MGSIGRPSRGSRPVLAEFAFTEVGFAGDGVCLAGLRRFNFMVERQDWISTMSRRKQAAGSAGGPCRRVRLRPSLTKASGGWLRA